MIKAIIYDFDGTLTLDMHPEFAILEKAGLIGGCDNPEFFRTVNDIAKREQLNPFDVMIRQIIAIIRDSGLKTTNDNIALGADKREFRPGVIAFLQKAKEKGIKNFLLSSGLKTYLKHTKIAPFFTEIYASTLIYDEKGEAIRPNHVMSPEAKIEALKDIATQVNGNPENCHSLAYVGDGPTDIPVMTYVKQHGGITIMLANEASAAEIEKVIRKKGDDPELIDVISESFPANFEENGELFRFIFG